MFITIQKAVRYTYAGIEIDMFFSNIELSPVFYFQYNSKPLLKLFYESFRKCHAYKKAEVTYLF